MALHDEILAAAEDEKKRRATRGGQLHGGVRGAHPQFGGMETDPHIAAADYDRYGPDARFTMGPEGRDTMDAGGPVYPVTKPHVDTEPYLRRREGEGTQLPLGTEGAFKPTDPIQHFVRLKHPHLNDYSFEHRGSDQNSHAITAYSGNAEVGFLRWNGRKALEPGGFHEGGLAPGEIEGVSVHPDHRGKGLSTAMWDYARAHNALHGSQEPVHSKDRSTAGNHWAHFVGGAALARQDGQDNSEYFEGSWR